MNFFILPEELTPTYPLWVSLRLGAWEIAMDSPVNGDGSCAGCHAAEAGPESAGPVYVFPLSGELPTEGCP